MRTFTVHYDQHEIPAGTGVIHPIFAAESEDELVAIEEAIHEAIASCHPDAKVLIHCDNDNGRLSIADDGCPPPKNTAAKVFAALRRVSRQIAKTRLTA